MANNALRNTEIIALHSDGYSCADIARRTGVAYKAVYGVIRRFGEKENQPTGAPALSDRQKEQTETTQDDDNHQTASSKSRRIQTLDQLLEACQVDLSVWTVDHWIANKWEVGAKDPDTGEILVSPLWQIKAWLKRIEPVKFEFTLEPVNISVSETKPAPAKQGKTSKALLWTDPHFGFSMDGRKLFNYHDRRALSIYAQIMREEEIDRSVCLGDLIDAAEWSDKFIKTPSFYFTTQPALIEAAWWIEILRTSHVLEGNHDKRIKTAQLTRLMYAYGLKNVDDLESYPALSVPSLLNMESRGVVWVDGYPDAELWLNDSICLAHGDKASNVPGGTAGAYLKDGKAHSVVVGHAHRQESAGRVVRSHGDNSIIQAHVVGCSCWTDGRVPGANKRSNWHQSCAVIEFDDSGWYNYTPVPVMEGQAFYNGRRYVGDDGINDQIARDTGLEV